MGIKFGGLAENSVNKILAGFNLAAWMTLPVGTPPPLALAHML